MIVEILTLGNELLDGRRVDTNTAWLGRQLTGYGFPPRYRQSTSDHVDDIAAAFRLAISRSDLVISTGGLGPTADDLTFEGLAQATDRTLQFHPSIWAQIEERFHRRGLSCPISNRRQAMLPEGAEEVPNDLGSAPGCRIQIGSCVVFALPGVNSEMKHLFERGVVPEIEKRLGKTSVVGERAFTFVGLPESHLEELLDQAGLTERFGSRLSIALTASFPTIGVTLHATAEREKETDKMLQEAETALLEKLGDYWVGTDEQTVEREIISTLKERSLKLAVAESLTGGMLASRFVDVPGSSSVVDRGVVAYSNESKTELLGVSPQTLEKFGAVSEECAIEMAAGLLDRSNTQVAVSTTGIAGPDGGSEEKPVGLTYVAWLGTDFREVQRYQFRWDRNRNRMLTVFEALKGLRRLLFSNPAR